MNEEELIEELCNQAVCLKCLSIGLIVRKISSHYEQMNKMKIQ